MKDEALDSLLRNWEVAAPPTLVGDDASPAGWDEGARRITEKAQAAPRAATRELDAVMGAPALESEPGEPSGDREGRGEKEKKKMSDDRDPPAAKPAQRRGGSLKELAERVSKTPPPSSVTGRTSSPSIPGEPAPPTKVSAPIATTSAPSSATATPVSAASPVVEKVAPVAAVAATAARPVNDVSAGSGMPKTLPTGAKPLQKKQGGSLGFLLGGGIVALAAAAGVAFYLHSRSVAKTPDTTTDVAASTAKPKAQATGDATGDEVTAKKDAPTHESGGIDFDKLQDASAAPSAAADVALGPGSLRALPSGSALAVADKAGPHHVNPDGTLSDAMDKAVGPQDKPVPGAEAAAGDTQPKNLPDLPPTGSVTSAISAARGAARGCVAGADKDSVAVVTFGSSGAATGVSVGGWAADKPAAASCIQAALMKARVEPFTKPSFSAPTTIRP